MIWISQHHKCRPWRFGGRSPRKCFGLVLARSARNGGLPLSGDPFLVHDDISRLRMKAEPATQSLVRWGLFKDLCQRSLLAVEPAVVAARNAEASGPIRRVIECGLLSGFHVRHFQKLLAGMVICRSGPNPNNERIRGGPVRAVCSLVPRRSP